MKGLSTLKLTINFVKSSDQLGDIFTMPLVNLRINYVCSKLGTYDWYAPA